MKQETWFDRHIPVWARVLKGRQVRDYLEIGTYQGRSLRWVLGNYPGCHANVIDPFVDSSGKPSPELEGSFLENMKDCSGRFRLLEVESWFGLVELSGPIFCMYDLIYIDGSHRAPDVLRDAAMAWPLLKIGGVMIFDDYTWKMWDEETETPKIAIDAFVRCYRKELKILHWDDQLIVEKI